MKKGYKFTKRYYKHLLKEADFLNETFKYEGINDRAIVFLREKGYEINILRVIHKGE